uniref:Uncharacterized protein n=1 Tax=Cacopsylla melanoneura TaxID=428564 RepID=A0A8D8ZBJ0_9HEMI
MCYITSKFHVLLCNLFGNMFIIYNIHNVIFCMVNIYIGKIPFMPHRHEISNRFFSTSSMPFLCSYYWESWLVYWECWLVYWESLVDLLRMLVGLLRKVMMVFGFIEILYITYNINLQKEKRNTK